MATQVEDRHQEFHKLGSELVAAIMKVYKQAMSCLLPTPAKSHYIFNLRDFSRVVVGICLVRKDRVDKRDVMIRQVVDSLRLLSVVLFSSLGGSVAEWLRRWTRNSEVASSIPGRGAVE